MTAIILAAIDQKRESEERASGNESDHLSRLRCRGSRVTFRGSRVAGRGSKVEGGKKVKKVNILSYIKLLNI